MGAAVWAQAGPSSLLAGDTSRGAHTLRPHVHGRVSRGRRLAQGTRGLLGAPGRVGQLGRVRLHACSLPEPLLLPPASSPPVFTRVSRTLPLSGPCSAPEASFPLWPLAGAARMKRHRLTPPYKSLVSSRLQWRVGRRSGFSRGLPLAVSARLLSRFRLYKVARQIALGPTLQTSF